MNESAPGTGDQINIVQKSPEGAVAAGPKLINLDLLADEFAAICSTDLDKDLKPEALRDKLIEKGFPAGLASYFGPTLLERLADARQTLAVAATKPKLKDSLVATVRDEVIEYFRSRETDIVRFFEVSQSPVNYLEIIGHVLSEADLDSLSVEDINKITDAAVNMRKKEVTEKLLKVTGKRIAEIIESDFSVKVSVGDIREDVGHERNPELALILELPSDSKLRNEKLAEISKYLQPKFPRIYIGQRDFVNSIILVHFRLITRYSV